MGRLSHEEKAKRARDVLIETIAKIDDLEPTLGGKWKIAMVEYYSNRLAELLLYQAGFQDPSKAAVVAVRLGIDSVLTDKKL